MHDQDHRTSEETSGCVEAIRELYVFLDGELTIERRTLIRAHLEHCVDCLEAYEFETELRVHIATCCQSDPMPATLVDRIRRALDA